MTYFKIDEVDYSGYVNELNINTAVKFNAQTNAAYNTVVDVANRKREIEVGIIPLDDKDMKKLLGAVAPFNVSISFRNPDTNLLETVNCIIPETNIKYYTIQGNKVQYKAFTLKFIEL